MKLTQVLRKSPISGGSKSGGGGGGGWGPNVGCRLQFHNFVGCRLKFSTFVSVNN